MDGGTRKTVFRRATLIAGGAFGICLLSQIILAEIGLFGRSGSLAFLLSGGLFLLIGAADLLCGLLASRSGIGERVFGVILVLGVATAVAVETTRWRHPTETLLGGYDEGVYAVAAVNLAHTGNYFFKASMLPDLSPSLQPWIIRRDPTMAVRTVGTPPRYPAYHTCLFVVDQARGLLAPQFTIGFPVVLGSVFSLFGYAGLHAVNFLVALGAAILTGLLATQWLGRTAGVVATVLMLWFPLHAWGANSLYAEPLVQLLWLFTLLGLSEASQNPHWAGLVTGLAAGLGLAVKIDGLPVALAAGLIGVAEIRRNARFAWTLLGALVASASVSLFSWWLYDRSYVESTLRALTDTSRIRVIAAIAGLLGLLAVAIFTRRRQTDERTNSSRPAWQRVLLALGCAVVAGLAAYAYFSRPHTIRPDSFYYWPGGTTILSHREDTFVRLGWYWRPWGLAAAVAGICILAIRARELWHWLALGLGLLCLVAFCYDVRNNPLQPYAMRRFLPAATPLLVLGASGLWTWVSQVTLRRTLTVASGVALAAGFFAVNEKLCATTEYPGLIAQIGQLAEKIPADSVVLTPDGTILSHLATPLEFAFGRPCLVTRGGVRVKGFDEAAKKAIRGWQAVGKRAFFLTPAMMDNLRLSGVPTRPFARGSIHTKVTVSTALRLVLNQSPLDIPWTLTEVPALSSPHPPNGPP